MKKIIWGLPGAFIGLLIYAQLFSILPREIRSAAVQPPPPTTQDDVVIPTFDIRPLQHYRMDEEILRLFEEKGILAYGKPNPMFFEVPTVRDIPLPLPEAPPITGTQMGSNDTLDTFRKHSVLPVDFDNFKLSSNFGWREDPFNEDFAMHYGIDIAAPAGSSVFAVLGGTVESVGNDEEGGLIVVVNHGGYQTSYMHLQEATVKAGDAVRPGTIIGKVGNTGRSTGPHLHFEIRINGTAVDPMDYLIIHFKDISVPMSESSTAT